MSRTIGWPVGRAPGSPVGAPIFLQSVKNGNGGAVIGPSTIFDFDGYTGPNPYASPIVTIPFDTGYQVLHWDTDLTRNHTTSTGKEYIEMEITENNTPTRELESWYFGFNNASQTARQDSPSLLGIEKDSSSGAYRAHYGGSSHTYSAISNITNGYELQEGDKWGVAVDWDAGKVYVHLNGTWATSGGGLGGEPGVGAGYTIAGTSQNKRIAWGARVFLTAAGESITVAAVTPSFLPSGYTALT
jgi:hypothetical protein